MWNGFICSVDAKAYDDTWLMSPNQLRTSVMLRGAGKSWIASKYWENGRTMVGVISKPANVTVVLAKESLLDWYRMSRAILLLGIMNLRSNQTT